MGDSGDCTRLLEALRGGDASLWPRLLELTYGELRALAERQLLRERRGHTLQPTALYVG